MDSLIVLLLLALVGLVLIGPILALAAFLRVRDLKNRVTRLEEMQRESRRVPRDAPQVVRTPEPPEPTPAAAPATARPAPPEKTVAIEPPVEAPAPSTTPRASVFAEIEWERWLGIRGAALLGAVALGLAGLLFFKYSIERGLITPVMRVVLGTLAGLGCIAGSLLLRKRKYAYAADAVAGAGTVILYAAFWAAHMLYGLIGPVLAYGLMILVTVTCCALALRTSSLLVAVLGLIGGFATPLLLSTGSDRPIGLFGYVLLLDLGMLALGHKKRWPSLALLSLLATVIMQALWVGARMGPDRIILGLLILAVFVVLFVAAGRLVDPTGSRREWFWTQAGAILFPFAFALYFAGRSGLSERLWPIALLLGMLCAAAGWLAAARRVPPLSIGAAAASVAVVGVWSIERVLDAAAAWELAAVAAGLSLLFHIFVERDPQTHDLNGPGPAFYLVSGGMFLLTLLAAAAAADVSVWPPVAAWVVLAVLAYRQAGFPGRSLMQIVAAAALGIGLTTLHALHHERPGFSVTAVFLALMVAAPLALHGVAWLRRQQDLGVHADHATATLAWVLVLGLAGSPMLARLAALPALAVTLVLGALVLLAATRLGRSEWYAAAVFGTAVAHFAWTATRRGLADTTGEALTAFSLQAVAVIVFTGWLFLAVRRFGSATYARWAAALAAPLWFLPLKRLFELSFGDTFIGLLPVALGGLSLAALVLARKAWSDEEPARLSALVWFAAVALGFLSVAIPLQLDKEWITIGWALEGFAVLALWKRLDHPGLKYFGLALLTAVTVRLVANPELLDYYPRSGIRFFNWLLYTYLVPAAAMLGGAALLRPLELDRRRGWEKQFYGLGKPLGSILISFSAVLVVFVWINLAIADWFATGKTLTLSFGSNPAQRLTVSIAWAIYALILLGIGMSRRVQGLRWVSLVFLLFTIGKVFLYDLGTLEDLYRVASLVGLAVSLILVSLLYQRFVFRANHQESS